jgi:O-antigen/teichoic acid export membrane protein
MGSTEKIVSGVVWSTFVNIVNAVYGFIAVPLLIRYFGKAEYGLIGLAMSINVYMNLMDMGFNSTNVRFFSTWLSNKNYPRLIQGFQTSLSFYGIVGLLNALILWIISIFSDDIFQVTAEQNMILKDLLYILCIYAFCSWFSSCFDQLVKATENIAWVQRRTLLTKVLMIIVLFCTITFHFSIQTYFLWTMLAQMAIIPLSIRKIRKELPFISFRPQWHRESFKEMLPYCLNIFSFSLFQFSFYNLRPVFLGMQGSVEAVADFRILNGIIGIVTMLGGAFTGILLPSTSKVVAENNQSAYFRMAYDGTKYVSILCCFCCFGMMSVGKEVITLYVGESYLYLLPWFNMWLLCTLGTHNQAISSLILAGSDIRAISYSSVFASLVGLVISWYLIPYYQIGGVCLGFVAYMLIQLGFYYIYYWPKVMKINSFRVLTYSFMPYVLTGIIAFYIAYLIPVIHSIFVTFVIKGILFSIIFIIGIVVLTNKEDKKMMIEFIRHR